MGKKIVLHVCEGFGGGVFTYITQITNRISDKYSFYIAYSLRKETPENFQERFTDNVKFIKLNYFCREINIIKDIKSVCEIRKIVRELKPDIIHLHSSKAGAIGRIAFAKSRIPLFYTANGYGFLMENVSKSKRMLYKTIERLLGCVKCITLCPGPGEYKAALTVTNNAICINNGIDIDEMDKLIPRKKGDERTGQIVVYTASRIVYQKNPKLFNSIAEAMPNVKFLWLWDGELRHELTSPNIEITGNISREEAIKKAYEADVLLLPSLWEGLPFAILEAMYMKKLCVVSDVIGNHDVIQNGVNGFVCNTLEDYVDAINQARSKKAIKMTENAYNDIIETYNTRVMTSKIDEVYQEVLKK